MHLVASREWGKPGGYLSSAAGRAVAACAWLAGGWDSIRTRLVLLALVATVPLLVLVAVNARQDLVYAQGEAQMEALRVAQLHANLLDEHIQAVDVLLRGVGTAVAAEPDDAARAALLREVVGQLPPPYTDLFLTPPGPTPPNPYGLILDGGSPSPGRGVLVGRPVTGADGRAVGVLNAASRLDRLPRLETRDLPGGSVVLVLDERGVVLARSPDYDAWVGRDLSDQPAVRLALSRRQGTDDLLGGGAVSHLAAYTTATRVPWLVYVGLPSEIVLGSSRVALLRNLWFGVLALAGAVLLAWLIASRITAPLRHLAADAAALGRGDLSRRASATGGDEVGVLAAVFNQMAADVGQHVAEVRTSQAREQEARLAAEAASRQIAEREQRLQDLVRRLQVAQEEERRRVAYEIHDGLAQVAASAHQHLQTFADYYSPRTPDERDSLERTVELVQRTVREARRLIAGLRPTVLDDFGLATAIRLEVEALRGEGWQVTYHEDLGDQRLPSPIETALYRVAQEALTNVRKHAGRTQVAVTLEHTPGSVRLQVRDRGRGFGAPSPHDRARPGERVGLLGMQERVALLGGHCRVTSTPGAGTRVVADVPVQQPAETAGAASGDGD